MTTLTLEERKALWGKIEEMWEGRCRTQGYSDKERVDQQGGFFAGAIAAMSAMGLADECVTPLKWYFSIIRGDMIKHD